MLHCVILLLAAASAVLAATDYCKVNPRHTMCLYRGVSPTCTKGGRFSRGLANGNIATILSAHNRLRNQVASGAEKRGNSGPQPSASNMQRLYWDQEIADIAQRWVDQCRWGHDESRNVPNSSVGQNLYLKSQSPCKSMDDNRDWDQAVQSWYDEVASFDKNGVDKYKFDAKTGHYTQVVWANTNRVGCGYALFQEGDWCKKYYACNYKPSGNYIDQPMYKRGSPRSACPAGLPAADPKYPALC